MVTPIAALASVDKPLDPELVVVDELVVEVEAVEVPVPVEVK